ncbi:phage tail protein [Sphingobacterium cellulitidis]|uniref:phage tail protein n=1 Tax=Sphingobacterium cellulitidis TaxID=1768011 RepID=UPI000B9445ED|nr:glycerol acyltransferase [Sphingobacterium cellulitidis]
MPDSFYQTVNFHFSVNFNLKGNKTVDIKFQSVTGLDSSIDVETIKEGGENRFEHVVPVRHKYGPLVLKRGLIAPGESAITDWLKRAFDDQQYEPLEMVIINLLDEQHQSLMHWKINNVWPRSWKLSELNAGRAEILIETLELNFNRLIFQKS